MHIEVNKGDLKRITGKLKDLENAPKHLRNAINRTATQAMKLIRAGRSKGYTIKPGRFNKDIKVVRANAAHLDAVIHAKGRPPTLSGSFKTTFPKAGGKADVTKSGLKKLISSTGGAAFIPTGGKAAGLLAQREGPGRFPIKVLYGNSVPKMVEKIWKGERGGQGHVEDKVKKILHDELMTEVEKII